MRSVTRSYAHQPLSYAHQPLLRSQSHEGLSRSQSPVMLLCGSSHRKSPSLEAVDEKVMQIAKSFSWIVINREGREAQGPELQSFLMNKEIVQQETKENRAASQKPDQQGSPKGSLFTQMMYEIRFGYPESQRAL